MNEKLAFNSTLASLARPASTNRLGASGRESVGPFQDQHRVRTCRKAVDEPKVAVRPPVSGVEALDPGLEDLAGSELAAVDQPDPAVRQACLGAECQRFRPTADVDLKFVERRARCGIGGRETDGGRRDDVDIEPGLSGDAVHEDLGRRRARKIDREVAGVLRKQAGNSRLPALNGGDERGRIRNRPDGVVEGQ